MPNDEVPDVIIRPEQGDDGAAIFTVHRAAFGRDDEALLVDALRDSQAVLASIVAAASHQIVGHALFSAAWIDSDTASLLIASLAPIAVLPGLHKKGIGGALVREGIETCAQAGYPAVIVVGHPAYYPRFGFSPAAVAHLRSPYAGDAFMGLDLRPGFLAAAQGGIRYPPAFEDL